MALALRRAWRPDLLAHREEIDGRPLQLISCAASEVAAMIEGAVWHGTTMALEGNYVDSHGQPRSGSRSSAYSASISSPRIKQINKVKLYPPDRGNPDAYRP